MRIVATRAQRSERERRSILRSRLDERREEIEQALMTRVAAIDDGLSAADPAYVEGLRAAIRTSLDYALDTIERGDEAGPPIPVHLLSQARIAARNGVSLETVLRRYFAGYSLLGYFVLEEAGRENLLRGPDLQRIVGVQASIFDRLLAAVGEEHAKEDELRVLPAERRNVERIRRLLDGEIVDTADIAYDFSGWHTGLVATGNEAEGTIRDLAGLVDCHLLVLNCEDDRSWGWLGARRQLEPAEILSRLPPSQGDVRVGMGEAGPGLNGWRRTHHQAAAALRVPTQEGGGVSRYRDVALDASMIQDQLLIASLRQMFLEPLEQERDGGETLRETLRAYFAASRNAASAASALGISRQAVNGRLRAVEERLECPLGSCAPSLEFALRVAELTEQLIPPLASAEE